MPVCRVFIPKANGRQRPLGVRTREDKIIQCAAVEVLNATDFLGFSYGWVWQVFLAQLWHLTLAHLRQVAVQRRGIEMRSKRDC